MDAAVAEPSESASRSLGEGMRVIARIRPMVEWEEGETAVLEAGEGDENTVSVPCACCNASAFRVGRAHVLNVQLSFAHLLDSSIHVNVTFEQLSYRAMACWGCTPIDCCATTIHERVEKCVGVPIMQSTSPTPPQLNSLTTVPRARFHVQHKSDECLCLCLTFTLCGTCRLSSHSRSTDTNQCSHMTEFPHRGPTAITRMCMRCLLLSCSP